MYLTFMRVPYVYLKTLYYLYSSKRDMNIKFYKGVREITNSIQEIVPLSSQNILNSNYYFIILQISKFPIR
jgi:hypothetical protein